MNSDREIKYLLTGDASQIKSELASVQKAAELTGKSVDRAMTAAFKASAAELTKAFEKNLETINKGLNSIQKGTQNAFNGQSVAQYAKQQSALATELQKLDTRYKGLVKTADDYRKTLLRSGTDAATAGSITESWLKREKSSIESTGRSLDKNLGKQFGGIASLAPSLAVGIRQVDKETADLARRAQEAADAEANAAEGLKSWLGRSARGDISFASNAVLDFGTSIRTATQDVARMGLGLVAALAIFTTPAILQTTSLIESAQIGLEGLLKSAEAAGRQIYNIYQFANETPYETASLIAYEQKLVSVGLTGQQAFGVIQRVSDVGGAFGASSDQLDRFYYVISQIFGAGRAMGQDFLQIQNSLPGFIGAIGSVMGKSAGEVRAAFGDGSVTSQVIVDALNELTKEGGVAFQGAAKQSETFAGILNNLTDNLKRAGLALFGVTVTMKGMEVSADGLYARLKNLMNAILEFASNPLVLTVFTKVGDTIGATLSVLAKYPQTIALLSGLFLAFASDLITRIPFIGNLIGGIGYATGAVLGVFAAMVTASRDMQRALVAVFGSVIQFVNANKSLFADLLTNFKQLLTTIGDGVAPALVIATQLFLNLVKVILVVINSVLAFANALSQLLGPQLTQAVSLTLTFAAVGLALAPVIKNLVVAIAALSTALGAATVRFALVIAAIVMLISLLGGFRSVGNNFDSLLDLGDIFDGITDSSEETSSGLDNIGDAIGGVGDAAKQATKQLAAFDKMNVIYSPNDSGSGGGGAGGGISGLDIPKPKIPDMSGLKDQLKKMMDDLNGLKPKANWWDFLLIPIGILAGWSLLGKYIMGIPGPILASMFAFSGLKKGITVAFTALAGFVTKAPIWATLIAAALALVVVAILNWDSIAPVLTDMFNKATEAFMAFVTGLPESLPKVVDSISSIIAGVAEQFPILAKAAVDAIASIILTVADSLPGLLETLSTGFNKLLEALPGIIDAVAVGLAAIISGLAVIIPKIITAIVSALPSLINSLTDILNRLLTAIISMIPMLVGVAVSLINSLVSIITENLPTVIDAILKLVVAIIDALLTALPLLVNAAITLVMVLATAILDSLPVIIEAAIELVVNIATALVDALPMIINAAIVLVAGLATAIMNNLPTIINAAINLIITLAIALVDNLPKIVDAAIKLIVILATTLVDSLPLIIDAAIRLVIALVKGILDNLPKLIDAAFKLVFAIAVALIDNIPKLIEAALKLITALGKGLWDNREKVLSSIASIGKSIIDQFGKIDMGKIGSDLVKGLWSGIGNMGAWIGGKISGFGDGIVKDLKSFFGIHSPSRLMRDEVGQMLGEGIGVGIQQSTKSAVNAANQSASLIGGALSKIDVSSPIDIAKDYISGVAGAIDGTTSIVASGISPDMSDFYDSDTMYNARPDWVNELIDAVKNKDENTSVSVYLDGKKVGGAISSSINDRTMVTGVNQIYV